MQAMETAPWSISEADYPAAAPAGEQLAFLLGYAVLAPSGHNTQPWRFRIDGDTLLLFADHERRLPAVDPRDRELAMSCGAALFFLRVAIRRFGRVDEVELFPDAADPDLLAAVRLGAPAEPPVEVMRLFQAIPGRRTHRLAFEEHDVSPIAALELEQAADDEAAWLLRVARGLRPAVAELVREGDEAQFADATFRHELSAWMRWNGTHSHDGIPGAALGIPDVVSPLAPAVVGALNLGAMWGGRSRQAAENAPLLAVLGTDGDGPAAWLAAGQALARVLLKARALGLAASFLNQPVEVPALRQRLRALLGTPGWPQALLRIGYPHGRTPHTPRRGVEEVLERE